MATSSGANEAPLNSKIRVKLGQIEVEYEGSDRFIKEELQGLLVKMSELKGVGENVDKPGTGNPAAIPSKKNNLEAPLGTTATLVTKLGDKSGTGLLLAACAHITLVKGQETFERQRILDEMRSATGYFKKSFSNNLSSYLARLVQDNQLLELSRGQYCLTADSRADLQHRLMSN